MIYYRPSKYFLSLHPDLQTERLNLNTIFKINKYNVSTLYLHCDPMTGAAEVSECYAETPWEARIGSHIFRYASLSQMEADFERLFNGTFVFGPTDCHWHVYDGNQNDYYEEE